MLLPGGLISEPLLYRNNDLYLTSSIHSLTRFEKSDNNSTTIAFNSLASGTYTQPIYRFLRSLFFKGDFKRIKELVW